jgi:hypothetical protein
MAAFSSSSPARTAQASLDACYIDALNGVPHAASVAVDRNDGLPIVGWAAKVKSGSSPEAVFVKLEADGLVFLAPADKQDRPDVVAAFRAPGLLRSGFHINADAASVPEGNYTLKLLARFKDGMLECNTQRTISIY